MLRDLLFACRMVRRSPAFTAVAVLTLGLGIGANTAIFSLIDAIFLHGLPFARPAELVNIQNDFKERNIIAGPVSITKFEHFRDNQSTLTGLAADTFSTRTLSGHGDPVQVNTIQMSSNEFDLLGVRPLSGRLFRPDEESAGEHVALLSAEYWDRAFQRNAAVVGQVITLDGVAHTVVGIMPPMPVAYFGGVDLYTTRPEEFPGMTPELRARGFSFLRLMGRVKPGLTAAQVQANFAALEATYLRDNGTKADAEWHPTVVDLVANTLGGQLQSTLWLLLGAVGFVLLIATSNVANLLLVRFAARRREISVRLSLGANRQRVIRLCLFESLLISVLAALVGVIGARLALKVLIHLNAPLPIGQTVSLSWLVLAFTAGIAFTTGFAIGLYPAIQASGTNLVDGLLEGGRANTMSRGQHAFRRVLIGGQVALSCALLMGAFLIIASVRHLQQVAPGFAPHGVLAAGVNLPSSRYPSRVELGVFERRFLEAIRHAPGVSDASLGIGVPFVGFSFGSPYSRADGKFVPYARRPLAPVRFVSSHYFSTLGIPLKAGRQFIDDDRLESARVVILSEGAARTLFPEVADSTALLGEHILIGATNQGENAEIVGIAADVRSNLQATTPVDFYRPLAQQTSNSSNWTLVVRTSLADPTTLTSAIRAALRSIDPDVPVVNPTTMETAIERSIGSQRLLMALLGVFAGLALTLAVVGIYGVVAYSVSQRRTEIGVRMALGAVPREIVGLVMRQGLTPVLVGLVVGILVAAELGRFLESQLVGLSRFDPLSFALTVTSLLAASLAACWIPSWRASRIGPSMALRG